MSNNVMPYKFTCACCHETFDEGWSREEAIAEKEKNFGGLTLEKFAVVCDDCYKKIMGHMCHPIKHVIQIVEK